MTLSKTTSQERATSLRIIHLWSLYHLCIKLPWKQQAASIHAVWSVFHFFSSIFCRTKEKDINVVWYLTCPIMYLMYLHIFSSWCGLSQARQGKWNLVGYFGNFKYPLALEQKSFLLNNEPWWVLGKLKHPSWIKTSPAQKGRTLHSLAVRRQYKRCLFQKCLGSATMTVPRLGCIGLKFSFFVVQEEVLVVNSVHDGFLCAWQYSSCVLGKGTFLSSDIQIGIGLMFMSHENDSFSKVCVCDFCFAIKCFHHSLHTWTWCRTFTFLIHDYNVTPTPFSRYLFFTLEILRAWEVWYIVRLE